MDIVDGYLNPGDKIIVRLGDRRFGARGTRAQTFVEEDWRMRWYIDPVGTSRFAAIKPDISIKIHSGPIAKVKILSPRLVRPACPFPVHVHTEDIWGNATVNQKAREVNLRLIDEKDGSVLSDERFPLGEIGWTFCSPTFSLPKEGDYTIAAKVTASSGDVLVESQEYASARATAPAPRILFADLHVHSDDTVGTNDTTYNFSYAQKIAGLDVVGYTANDFNITAARWQKTLDIIREVNTPGEFVVFPGPNGVATPPREEITMLYFWTTPRRRSQNFRLTSMETSFAVSSGMKMALLSWFPGRGRWMRSTQPMLMRRRRT